MKTDEIYRKIVAELRRGGRPSFPLDAGELGEIKERWERALHPFHSATLSKLLCLLGHSRTLTADFDKLFWRTLAHPSCDSQTLILSLAALSRQVIDRCVQKGERPPMELIEGLRPLLAHPDGEVLEWSLRTVERLGPQGVLLKGEVAKRRLGFGRWFDPHLRHAGQLIALLKKRWEQT